MFGKLTMSSFQTLICHRFKAQTCCIVTGRLLSITHIECYVIKCNELSTSWLKRKRIKIWRKTIQKSNETRKMFELIIQLAYEWTEWAFLWLGMKMYHIFLVPFCAKYTKRKFSIDKSRKTFVNIKSESQNTYKLCCILDVHRNRVTILSIQKINNNISQMPTNYGKLWSQVYLQEICKCILNPSHTLRNGHSLSEFQQIFTHFGSFFSVSRLQKKIGKKIFELKMYTDTKHIFYDINGWLSRINLDYRNACHHILWSSFYAQAPEILKCILNWSC